MQQVEINKIKSDVGRHFKHPADIVNHADLDTEQKITLLKEWEIDLRQMMVASEENMPSTQKAGDTADMLTQVTDALEELGTHSDAAKEHAPTKLG